MGVRGLTSYIARHAEIYLNNYELHDCNLVIDGDNLACNLYKDFAGIYSAFGGDYDEFYRAVIEFFHVLFECKITSYVIMDGGYDYTKLRTVNKRLRGKIAVIKRVNPCGSMPVFPVMMKEVFIDACRFVDVPVMRCLFEADYELASLSRKLHCPVLSYDSDFYIHNVKYIPLITLTVKAHTKILTAEDNDESSNKTKLRKNQVKHLEKLTKANRILRDIQRENVDKKSFKKGKSYKYLDCCMYRIENLIERGSLSKEKLPLFAALLGNDYIARSSFKNFFTNGMGKIGRSRKLKQQQKRIRLILNWLKHETLESALEKILSRLRKGQRESLMAQVHAATSGYSNEICHSYDFFIANYENAFANNIVFSDDSDSGPEEYVSEEELIEESTDDEEDENTEESESSIEENANNGSFKNSPSQTDSNDDAEDGDNNDNEEDQNDVNEQFQEDITETFPTWFLEKLYPGNLPRFFVDLMHLKKYINSPQIEHFPYNDCHEIAVPILVYIFTLLHSVNELKASESQNDNESSKQQQSPFELTYLTRATRVTNIRYYKYPIEDITTFKYSFDPLKPNPMLLRRIFDGTMHNFESNELFDKINLLPKDLRLYFLAIVYWLQKSQHCDLLHLHSLLICVVVLRTIDSNIPAERNLKAFQKRFGKIIKKERAIRDKETQDGVKRTVKEELKHLSIPNRMDHIPKSDCYLVQDNLLKHFHMQEIFKKKYDLYSTIILHAFAEFQSCVFQIYSLNSLLDFPFINPRMGELYSGVFLYNLYVLLSSRQDVQYYVQNFIFHDSQMMFDFYSFLWSWCEDFIPHWKREQFKEASQSINKKTLKKKRQAERKKNKQSVPVSETTGDLLSKIDDMTNEEDDFFDVNNKFCQFLKLK